ncbi:MAG: (d)CMP kinase [candidate division Zixibacteria bacterium]|nr:(d)CMP kinase [candidate division Zixibacteria bacterium]
MNSGNYNLSWLKGKIIAIDGPAGSGKSTTAKLLASRLGYTYLDTGAMYRALTYYALKHDVSPSDSTALGKLAEKLPITFKTEGDINRVFIAGQEVTDEIRTPEVTRQVSEVSAHKDIRKAMVRQQIEMGRAGSIVAEGRDTTTVVFTHADLKIYLDASVEERARRRLIDLVRMGESTNLEELKKEIQRRDDYDSNRKHSPLTRAQGVIMVDTTDMTIEGQVKWILSLIFDRFHGS